VIEIVAVPSDVINLSEAAYPFFGARTGILVGRAILPMWNLDIRGATGRQHSGDFLHRDPIVWNVFQYVETGQQINRRRRQRQRR
jgi:hypothetical protein